MLGWPVRRTRMFSAGLNRNKIAWLGPESSEDLLEDFMSFFAASVEVDGGVFLISSEEDVLAEEKRMARCRGHNFFSDVTKLEKHQYLAPGQLVRLEEYKRMYSNLQGECATKSFFADLDQNVKGAGGASTAGSMIPSLLTHTALYACHSDADRLVTPEELYFAHGYNCIKLPKDSAARSCRIKGCLKKLTAPQQIQLLGNGWHLAVLSSWVTYILSHCVFLNRTMSFQPEKSLLRRGGSQLCELETPEKKRKTENDDDAASKVTVTLPLPD